VKIRHRVDAIAPHEKCVVVCDLASGRSWRESYDHLLIATGSQPIDPELPGREAAGIFPIKNLAGGIALRRELDAREIRRVVVVGAGYIGLEMVENLLLRGLEVTVVEQGNQVLPLLAPELAAQVEQAVAAGGAALHLGKPLLGYEMKNGRVSGVATDKQSLPADLVVLGMGVRPSSELAEAAGIELGIKKAIRTDKRMATSSHGIWAAGDCAESYHVIDGRPYYLPLGTVANRHGRAAGANIAGDRVDYGGTAGTAVTRTCGAEVGMTGLLEKELRESGIEVVSETVQSRTRSGYFPGAGPIAVRLTADAASGRILGGQIVGGEGAAKRIDVVAVAVQSGLTAAQMSELDLGYAPPFSPVWDPVVIAARQLSKKL
jgi:NADPH-dependent 2,4-dienoyl-CoA reductase/sulfur reductase-like enzyme